MLNTPLLAHPADLLQCPEQQAFEFADIHAPARRREQPLPMRCPGRENYLLWRAEVSPPGRPGLRLCLEVTQERGSHGAILSHRLRVLPAAA